MVSTTIESRPKTGASPEILKMIEPINSFTSQITPSRLFSRLRPPVHQIISLFVFCIFISVLITACGLSGSNDSIGIGQNASRIELQQPEDLKPLPLGKNGQIQIVASTTIIADVVDNIGGDHLELAELIPLGSDPHAYQPTPGDLQVLYGADLILLNGFDLEAELEDILAPVSHSVPVISLSEGLRARTLEGDATHSEIATHSDGLDPHVWFDPILVSYWVDRIEQSLSRLDPAHAEEFQVNTKRYQDELSELDQWIAEQVSSLPSDQRKLVLDHLVLGYFADHYGFKMLNALIPGFSTAAEASPREIAELSDMILAEGVPAIFIGVDTNPRLAEQIAGDLDIQVIELYTSSLGPVGGPADSYLEMMQYNVLAIKQALSPE
jgi:ABC-type Zn uptake system ZnuABC Zn-binding protein ZnuA